MQSGPLVIACGSDDNYARPLAVTLYSALRNLKASGRPVDLYVFDGGISTESKNRLHRVVEGASDGSVHLEWVDPDTSALGNLPTREGVSTGAYLRLLIPEHVPADTDRVIYLDSDLLVKADLTRLWDKSMDGRMLMAVQAYNIPYVSSERGIRKYEELGLAPDTPYFNSGVLMLDVDRWQQENVSERVCRYMRTYREHVNMCDQEGLNAVLAGNWKPLDPRWNVMALPKYFENLTSSAHKESVCSTHDNGLIKPFIWHFAGPHSKPWMVECRHPAQFEWMRCLRESGWYRPVEGAQRLGHWYVRYAWRRIAGAVESRMIGTNKT
nr:glycosyltransferase family 8 protein [Salinibacter ruber]